MHIQQPPKLIVAHMPNVPRLTMSALPVVFTPTYITGGPMQFLQTTFDSVVARHPVAPGGGVHSGGGFDLGRRGDLILVECGDHGVLCRIFVR
jgi:hypothetical protein